MKIIITGGNGFIGRHFIRALVQQYGKSAELILIQKKVDANLKTIVTDLAKVEDFQDVVLDADYFYHIAASAEVNSSNRSVDQDFIILQKILKILSKSTKLTRFIYISSIGAYDRHGDDDLSLPLTNKSIPHPRSKYGQQKLKSEKEITASTVPYTIIRPAWVWGSGMRKNSHLAFFDQLARSSHPLMRIGFTGDVSLINVKDLASSMVKIINDDKKYLNKAYFAATEKHPIYELQRKIWLINNKSTFVFLFPFIKILKFFHPKLPLAFNFLFLDYLVCDHSDFIHHFQCESYFHIDKNIQEIQHTDTYALVTGANNGIGYELAKKLKTYYHLILIDKDIDKVLQDFPQANCIKMDLSDLTFDKLSLLEPYKPNLSLLVNNAGVGFKGHISQQKWQLDLLVLDVNIKAPILLTRFFLDTLRAKKGIVVNIVSSVAYFPVPGMAAYSASKSFMLFWSSSLAVELADDLTCITFSPSGTKTNFQKNAGVTQTSDLMDPSFVASKIFLAILKNKSKTILLGLKAKILVCLMKALPISIGAKIISKLFEGAR